MTERFLKFPLFNLVNKEIQSGKIQNDVYILNFLILFSAEFPHSQDKIAGISKKKFCHSLPYLYKLYIP